MKHIFITILVVTGMVCTCHAQDRPRRDTLSFGAWKRAVMKVPVLTGETEPRIIVPHEGRLCFPVEFDLKISIPGKIVEQAMFINSEIGLTAYLPPSASGLVNMLFPELEDFSFFIIGLKGNVYHYFNTQGKNNAIEHWVSTGNTEVHQYQPTGNTFTAAAVLDRKNVTAPYCNGTITCMAYRFSTNPDLTYYVYGDHFPAKLHPKKYLGNFGVGYLQTTEGLYLITEFRSSAYSCKVNDILNMNTCLNTNIFNSHEDRYIEKRGEDLRREKEKLDREAARISGDCAGERTTLLNWRKEQQRKQEETLRHFKDGNTHQDVATQQRVLSMMDPLTMVQEGILVTRVDICQAQKRADHGSSGAAEKVNCLTGQLGALQALEAQLQAIDSRYPTDPGRAYMEKSQLYSRLRPAGCR